MTEPEAALLRLDLCVELAKRGVAFRTLPTNTISLRVGARTVLVEIPGDIGRIHAFDDQALSAAQAAAETDSAYARGAHGGIWIGNSITDLLVWLNIP